MGSWPTEEECREAKAWLDEKLPALKCEVVLPPKSTDEETPRNDTTTETTRGQAQAQAISHEASQEIQRLYEEGIISQHEYEKIAHAHKKYEREVSPKRQPNDSPANTDTTPNRRIPDVYDAYARRLNSSYWVNHRLYDANISYMQRMSLMEFCRKFAVPQKGRHAGKIKYHKNGVITRKLVFQPQYSSDPNYEGGRDYGQYCRFALVRYRPWVDAPFGRVDNGSGRLVEHTPRDEECIQQWKDHLLELRDRMRLIPDVLLPEELKGGGAGIELLVVPVVERTDEPEEVEGEANTGLSQHVEENGDEDDEDDLEETSICLSSVMEPEDGECSTASCLSTNHDTVQPVTTDHDQASVLSQDHTDPNATADSVSSSPQDDQSSHTSDIPIEPVRQDNQSNQNNDADEESVVDDTYTNHHISSRVNEEDESSKGVKDDSSPRIAPIELTDNDSPRGIDEELNLAKELESFKKSVEESTTDPTLSVSYAFETETDQEIFSPKTDHQLPINHRRSSWAESLGNNSSAETKPDPQEEEADTETACSTSSERSFVQSSWDEASFGARSVNTVSSTPSETPVALQSSWDAASFGAQSTSEDISVSSTPSVPPAIPRSSWDEASFTAHPADTSDPISSTLSDPPSDAGPDGWDARFQDEADNFDQEVDTFAAKETSTFPRESGWETFGNVDFPTRNDVQTNDVWNTSRSFFMAPPSSPTRRLAPSRRDRASSPCRSPCRSPRRMSSAQALLDRADAIIQKADQIERKYAGDVSQVYKKIQDAEQEKVAAPEAKNENPHELFDFIEQAGDGLFGPAAFIATLPKSPNAEKYLLKSKRSVRAGYQ